MNLKLGCFPELAIHKSTPPRARPPPSPKKCPFSKSVLKHFFKMILGDFFRIKNELKIRMFSRISDSQIHTP